MDVLGATASAVQLTEYGRSALLQLVRLYQAVRNGPAACRDQQFNLSILLNIVNRVGQQEGLREDPIPQLLVDISALAKDIYALLETKGLFGLNWALITGRATLSEAFVSLNGKKDLLHLHISERTQNVLSQIRSDFFHMDREQIFPGKGNVLGSSTATDTREDKGPESSSFKAPEMKEKEFNVKGNETNDYENKEASTEVAPNGGAKLTGNKTTMRDRAQQAIACGYPQAPTLSNNESDVQGDAVNKDSKCAGLGLEVHDMLNHQWKKGRASFILFLVSKIIFHKLHRYRHKHSLGLG
ncbi:hypothetical protein EV356DRAFT_532733 [Viridothelium virens]|uniref:Uncharacterized protein n=1 Tax=Viridothelium virens TaxID=1048519 RepID=A0A6A6HB15_VIRVR|nr:hypothetical protein EV356DRAFT_532733 [Viridothelium virens]